MLPTVTVCGPGAVGASRRVTDVTDATAVEQSEARMRLLQVMDGDARDARIDERVPAPDAGVRTLRISHPAFFGTRREETIRFYSELLGMRIVLRQPNLDDPSMEHLFFHVGDDNFIAYFLPDDDGGETVDRYRQARHGVGGMHHLAIDVDAPSFEEACRRFDAAGVEYSGPVDRGYERSIYARDPNGVRVELLTWLTPPPDDLPQAEILARAQLHRRARGAEFVEDADIRTAIEELREEQRHARG